jgi:threonine dehydratase
LTTSTNIVPSGMGIDVRAAYERIRDWIYHTPLEPSSWLSELAGRPVLLKLENRQETGSFKARGALNFLLQLSPEERVRGVVTASAGNHGQALAWAAARLGVPATVVLPLDAVPIKVARTRSWGAMVVEHGHGYDEAHLHAERLAAETGAVYAPAFDHPHVIAGQGTVALEILEQRPDVTLIVAPVGGGGLITGTALAVAGRSANAARLDVLGVQSDHTAAMHDALQAGHLVPVVTSPTLADGLAGEVCQTTLDLCRALGVLVRLVPEEAILPAIGETLLREHLAVEGSAGVAVAAVLQGLLPRGDNGPVALVLSGGNVDPDVLAAAVAFVGQQEENEAAP